MFQQMRRKDRQISEDQALALLERGEYGILSTVSPEGQPYGTPLNYVVLDDHLYFHCAQAGQKLDNILHETKVSFCVVGETQPVYDKNFTTYFESVVVFGTAQMVEDKEEKSTMLLKLCEKYLPAHMDKAFDSIIKSIDRTAVVKVSMDHVTGKAKLK